MPEKKGTERRFAYGGAVFRYTVDRGARRHIYLCVSQGNVLVKAPLRAAEAEIARAVEQKAKWLAEKVEQTRLRGEAARHDYAAGERFRLLGEDCELKIACAADGLAAVERDGPYLRVRVPRADGPDDEEQAAGREQRAVKDAVDAFLARRAQEEVADSFSRMCARTGLAPKRITVRGLSRSWGRCTGKGGISINRNVVAFSRNVIDYVVLHELCHLKHLNHSAEFWRMVEEFMPDYRRRDAELKKRTGP